MYFTVVCLCANHFLITHRGVCSRMIGDAPREGLGAGSWELGGVRFCGKREGTETQVARCLTVVTTVLLLLLYRYCLVAL